MLVANGNLCRCSLKIRIRANLQVSKGKRLKGEEKNMESEKRIYHPIYKSKLRRAQHGKERKEVSEHEETLTNAFQNTYFSRLPLIFDERIYSFKL